MYLAYYNLNAKPFQISTDPAFLWLGPKHREALSTLRYGVMDNRGFLLLTGDVGTGKTTLIHALLKSLSQEVVAATVPDPGLAPLDFFNYISRGFNFGTRFASKGDFLDHFINFLETSHAAHKKVLLIIDESQRLTSDLLEEIRLLSNIEKFENKLLNIFFVGQNEFNQFLMLPNHKAIRQRITINYHITPLSEAETGAYIRHRLKVAGARMEIFDEDSIGEVFRFSGGYPRLINIICDHAMLTGFIKSAEILTAAMVRGCAADLTLPQSEILQAEVAKTRRPAVPPPPTPQPPPAAPTWKVRWQQPALLVALLAALLMGAFWLYPQGAARFKALWRTQFQGTAARTAAPPPAKAVLELPPPVKAPATPVVTSPIPAAAPRPDGAPPSTAVPTPAQPHPPQPAEKPAPPEAVLPAPEPPAGPAASSRAADATAQSPLPAAAPEPQPTPAAAIEDAGGAQDLGDEGDQQPAVAESAAETQPAEDASALSDPGDIIDWVLKKNKREE